ncbi:MAG: FAD-linked oxidase C-terminal domain-containing protein [Candidatus Ancaeobacter aquaticus]|nr:FAD-linked oxidase C-terminal domain-containing protein [Candidatus Ancaeobacter aquaticus]
MLSKDIVKQLKNIVGKDNLCDSMADRICYSYDASKQNFLPDIVVKPQSTREVSDIMKVAYSEELPVYTRGAASGLTGGSVPLEGGIVLDMMRMNKILELDTDNLIARVEPGVVVSDLQNVVAQEGLFYPPDPASNEFSTIGGNVAECAGGLRCLKYGVTRDYVLGMEVVLANGDIVNFGVKTLKGVTGYDIVRLLVGSEGTLGVFTQIIIRLIPIPESVKTCVAFYDDIMNAAQSVTSIIKNKIVPRTLEFMDKRTIECVEKYKETNISEGKAQALLLIEVDGVTSTIEKEIGQIQEECKKHGAYKVQIAQDDQERELLWSLRKSVSPALYQFSSGKINEDICVPRSAIPKMLESIEKISKAYSVIIVSFGHAGDGNIHLNVMVDFDDEDQLRRGEAAVEEIFKRTIELEGTLSGEHGIGNTKAQFLHLELGQEEITIMMKIKELFDPKGILNPGKIFDPSKQRVYRK